MVVTLLTPSTYCLRLTRLVLLLLHTALNPLLAAKYCILPNTYYDLQLSIHFQQRLLLRLPRLTICDAPHAAQRSARAIRIQTHACAAVPVRQSGFEIFVPSRSSTVPLTTRCLSTRTSRSPKRLSSRQQSRSCQSFTQV